MNEILINGSSRQVLAPSPMVAEAMAIREAVFLAQAFPTQDIIITFDSLCLINCL